MKFPIRSEDLSWSASTYRHLQRAGKQYTRISQKDLQRYIRLHAENAGSSKHTTGGPIGKRYVQSLQLHSKLSLLKLHSLAGRSSVLFSRAKVESPSLANARRMLKGCHCLHRFLIVLDSYVLQPSTALS